MASETKFVLNSICFIASGFNQWFAKAQVAYKAKAAFFVQWFPALRANLFLFLVVIVQWVRLILRSVGKGQTSKYEEQGAFAQRLHQYSPVLVLMQSSQISLTFSHTPFR
jgi:hypothetical protein